MKIFASDVDGTLLDPDHRITNSSRLAVRQLQDAGYSVVLVSGRHPMFLLPFHEELDLDTPLIGCNGAYIYDPGKREVCDFKEIKKAWVEEVLSVAHKYQMDIVLDGKGGLIKIRDRRGVFRNKRELHAFQFFEVEDVSKLDMPVCKIVIILGEEKKEREAFYAEIAGIAGLAPTSSASWLMDIMDAKVDKWEGIRRYLSLYYPELTGEKQALKILSIGDGDNDKRMLREADYSIAMGNASFDVQQCAQFLSLSNREEGFAHAVYHVLENWRSLEPLP